MSKLHKNFNQTSLGTCRFIQVSDEIRSIFLLLEACIHHLGSWDVLLGIGEILVQGVLTPGNALVNVGLGVVEPSSLSRLSSDHSIEVGSLLVLASSLNCVTLGTSLGEDLLTIGSTHDYQWSLVEVNQ